jgi:hypothetical protein
MFKVKKNYFGIVSTKGYKGDITKAPQKVLKHLFHLGHEGVEKGEKEPKNEPIDNAKED